MIANFKKAQKLGIKNIMKSSAEKTSSKKQSNHWEKNVLLKGKIDLADKRYSTFLQSFILMKERSVKTIVETGTARRGKFNFVGDGGSTILFGEWIEKYGGELYSVDIDRFCLWNAAKDLNDQTGRAHFIESDSIEFLKSFNKSIDFLYLDSYDYDDNCPAPSQNHHLQEIIAAYPLLTKKSIVMIDDCSFKNGGKGKLVIEYLLEKGWKLLAEGYQVILVQSL